MYFVFFVIPQIVAVVSRWYFLDKAPRLSIRIVIWILLSDTVFVNSIKISANTETAMLSGRVSFGSKKFGTN